MEDDSIVPGLALQNWRKHFSETYHKQIPYWQCHAPKELDNMDFRNVPLTDN
jgi:hypothetical protein